MRDEALVAVETCEEGVEASGSGCGGGLLSLCNVQRCDLYGLCGEGEGGVELCLCPEDANGEGKEVRFHFSRG